MCLYYLVPVHLAASAFVDHMFAVSTGSLSFWELRHVGAPTQSRTRVAALSAAARSSGNACGCGAPAPAAPDTSVERPSLELLPNGELRFTRGGWMNTQVRITALMRSGESMSFSLELDNNTSVAAAVRHSRHTDPLDLCAQAGIFASNLQLTEYVLINR